MKPSDAIAFAKALADETRQTIMKLCCCDWISVNGIVKELDVTQPTVSHHLAVLRKADLVEVQENGRETYYRLNQKRIVHCCGQIVMQFAPETKKSEINKTDNILEDLSSNLSEDDLK